MAVITLEYNPKNTLAKSIIRSIKSAGVFRVTEEKSPYNKEFVAEIQESRNSEGVVYEVFDGKICIISMKGHYM